MKDRKTAPTATRRQLTHNVSHALWNAASDLGSARSRICLDIPLFACRGKTLAFHGKRFASSVSAHGATQGPCQRISSPSYAQKVASHSRALNASRFEAPTRHAWQLDDTTRGLLVATQCSLDLPREITSAPTSLAFARSLFLENVTSHRGPQGCFAGALGRLGARQALWETHGARFVARRSLSCSRQSTHGPSELVRKNLLPHVIITPDVRNRCEALRRDSELAGVPPNNVRPPQGAWLPAAASSAAFPGAFLLPEQTSTKTTQPCGPRVLGRGDARSLSYRGRSYAACPRSLGWPVGSCNGRPSTVQDRPKPLAAVLGFSCSIHRPVSRQRISSRRKRTAPEGARGACQGLQSRSARRGLNILARGGGSETGRASYGSILVSSQVRGAISELPGGTSREHQRLMRGAEPTTGASRHLGQRIPYRSVR